MHFFGSPCLGAGGSWGTTPDAFQESLVNVASGDGSGRQTRGKFIVLGVGTTGGIQFVLNWSFSSSLMVMALNYCWICINRSHFQALGPQWTCS